jgi:hypothetical protein
VANGSNGTEDLRLKDQEDGLKEQGGEERQRRSFLGGAALSMNRLARLAQQRNGLAEVEPATGDDAETLLIQGARNFQLSEDPLLLL